MLGIAVIAAGAAVFGAQPKRARSLEYPRPDVREEQQVMVDGVAEIWQLKWTSPPKPECDDDDGIATTCPCIGFALGESGDLALVRMRNKDEIDRLSIARLFEEAFAGARGVAIIQRWPMDYKTEPDVLRQRPVVQVMQLADYDHDGQATEFYLQTEGLPCGKSAGVLIGLSAKNPHLHAFGKRSKPDEPLVLSKSAWNALREEKRPIEITDWNCGDHGAETETRLRLHWTPDGVDGTRREFSCPRGPQHLISEGPL